VNPVVLHLQTLLGQGLQPGKQAGEVIGNQRVVLDVVVAVEVSRKFLPAAMEKSSCRSVSAPVGLRLVQVGRDRRAIQHGMAAGLGLAAVSCRLSQCSTIFPSRNGNVETTFGPKSCNRYGQTRNWVLVKPHGIDPG